MSLTINTNLSSLIVQSSLSKSTKGLNQAIERMTTGFKVNGAKDNAAGYSIANSMGVKLSSFDVALDNVMLGTTLIDTASSNLSLVTEHLQRMRDLAEQAANGTYGEDSLNAIQSEIDARTDEINRVMLNTEYNGIKLFEGKETDGATANVDESKRVVNQTTFQSGETYYLTTSEDLVKLQDLVNSGVDTTNVTFELMNDIDMKGVSFRGIGTGGADGSDDTKFFKGNFDGNEHVISNLKINTSEDGAGLFVMSMGNIDSVGVENCDITGKQGVGGLAGANMGKISNSYVTGSVSGEMIVGGLVGTDIATSQTDNCCTNVKLNGMAYSGGLIGMNYGVINSSYAVSENINADGLLVGYSMNGKLLNCYYVEQAGGQIPAVGDGTYSGDINGIKASDLNKLIEGGSLPDFNYGNTTGGNVNNSGREFTLQVGIDSSENSKLTFDTALGFQLDIDVTTQKGALDAITAIDNILETVNNKQTEFGAVQNRLESVTEALSINIENLTSSMSTIKDADIAEESSNYIKYQILQQASATLLATANQIPSISLQLL